MFPLIIVLKIIKIYLLSLWCSPKVTILSTAVNIRPVTTVSYKFNLMCKAAIPGDKLDFLVNFADDICIFPIACL